VLVIEPDRLTRWSVQRFLERSFVVRGTGDMADAERLLDEQPVHAMVVSNNLDLHATRRVEQQARDRNARVLIVHTGIAPNPSDSGDIAFLEKPFQLSRLAQLLNAPASKGDEKEESP